MSTICEVDDSLRPFDNAQMKRNRRQNWALSMYVIFLGIVVAALVAWWTPDQGFAILAAATIASVVLVAWHPIKLLAAFQAALMGLFGHCAPFASMDARFAYERFRV
jgi:cell division protein FtsW (lipid II flippase)